MCIDGYCLNFSFKGPFKCYVMHTRVGVSHFPDKRYEGVMFNVISVTRRWVGGCQISRKKALCNTDTHNGSGPLFLRTRYIPPMQV